MFKADRVVVAVWILVALMAGCSGGHSGEHDDTVTGGGTGGSGAGPNGQGGDGSNGSGGTKGGSGNHAPGVGPDGKPLEHGDTDFVSADATGQQGGGTGAPTADGAMSAGAAGKGATADTGGFGNGSSRTVERGDLYRVLGDGRIINLNSYRGVQVIDIRDLSAP